MVTSPWIAPLPSRAGSDLALWLIDLDADPGSWDGALLSNGERERAQRFRFEVHARRYRASHIALRLILAQATGTHPAALQFTEGLHGKPRLTDTAGPRFNMSHSAGWALVGLCPGHAIGVDIELITPMDDAAALAARNFTATENLHFRHTPPDQRLEAFFRGWTRKEACLKALGSGLSIEPHTFEAGLGKHEQATFITVQGQPCAMHVASLDLPMPGLAAVARLAEANSPLAM